MNESEAPVSLRILKLSMHGLQYITSQQGTQFWINQVHRFWKWAIWYLVLIGGSPSSYTVNPPNTSNDRIKWALLQLSWRKQSACNLSPSEVQLPIVAKRSTMDDSTIFDKASILKVTIHCIALYWHNKSSGFFTKLKTEKTAFTTISWLHLYYVGWNLHNYGRNNNNYWSWHNTHTYT